MSRLHQDVCHVVSTVALVAVYMYLNCIGDWQDTAPIFSVRRCTRVRFRKRTLVHLQAETLRAEKIGITATCIHLYSDTSCSSGIRRHDIVPGVNAA